MVGTTHLKLAELKMFEERNMLTKEGHKVVIPDYNYFRRFFG